VPVQSGTATPWREVEGPGNPGPSAALYFRPGEVTGSADLLAEQMRADGLIPSLGPAIRLASEASLTLGWYGTNDDDEDELCDQDGWTTGGGRVDEPRRCVLALVDVSEV
jgi:hypothetical protein